MGKGDRRYAQVSQIKKEVGQVKNKKDEWDRDGKLKRWHTQKKYIIPKDEFPMEGFTEVYVADETLMSIPNAMCEPLRFVERIDPQQNPPQEPKPKIGSRRFIPQIRRRRKDGVLDYFPLTSEHL